MNESLIDAVKGVGLVLSLIVGVVTAATMTLYFRLGDIIEAIDRLTAAVAQRPDHE